LCCCLDASPIVDGDAEIKAVAATPSAIAAMMTPVSPFDNLDADKQALFV
jgi:hypothetical protein